MEYLGRNTERFKTVQVLNDLTVEKVLFVSNINDTRPTAGQVLTWDGRSITWKDDLHTPFNSGACVDYSLIQYDLSSNGFECTPLIYRESFGSKYITNNDDLMFNLDNTLTLSRGDYSTISSAMRFVVNNYGGAQELDVYGNFTIDCIGDIELNADGGDINFKDNTAQLAVINTNGLDFTDNTGAGIIFEGATDNAHKTTLSVIDPTGTRDINLPDASGTVALTSGIVTYSAGTGIDLAGTTFNLDLTEVIDTDSANRVLTSDGDGTLTAEASLTVSSVMEYTGNTFRLGNTQGTAFTLQKKNSSGASYHGGDLTIMAGNPQSGVATNKDGGDLVLKSGFSTGTGDPGKVDIWAGKEFGSSSGSGYLPEKIAEFSNPNGTSTFRVLDSASDYFHIATGSNTTISTANSGGNSDLTIIPQNDLKLRAASKQIKFGTSSGGGTDVVHWDMNSDNYKFMSTADLNDYFNINVGADAETTFTTVEDGAGSTAHMNFNADGNINLNSVGNTTIDSGGGDVVLKTSGSSKGGFKLAQVGSNCEIVGIQQTTVDLNQAQLNLIATANSNKGYVIIPALGSGLLPVVVSMHTHTMMASGTQNTVSQDFFLEYDDGVLKQSSQSIKYQRRFMYYMGTSGYQRLEEWRVYRGWLSTQAYPAWINTPVYLSASANPTSNSYSSMRIMVTFHVVKF